MNRPGRPILLTLPAAPLLGLLGVLLLPAQPAQPADPAGALAAIAGNAGIWLGANAALVAGQILLVVAMAVLGGLLHARASRLGAVGAALLAFSSVLHVGVLGFGLARLPIAGSTSPAAVPIAESLYSGIAFAVLIVPTLVTALVGVALLAAAVWRTRIAPRWVPVVLVAGVASDFVEPISGIGLFALWTVGFGTIAWSQLDRHAESVRA